MYYSNEAFLVVFIFFFVNVFPSKPRSVTPKLDNKKKETILLIVKLYSSGKNVSFVLT